jgi:N-acetylmuramoyl-L-alanine amidase
MRRKLIPLYDTRRAKVDMIVLHSVGLPAEDAIKSFAQLRVSSHYVVAEDGEIWQMVGEKHRAWHAGVASWQKREDINSRSIGIEFCSPSLGQTEFTAAQLEAAEILLNRLIHKYHVAPQNIVGHSDVSPTRKPDPGKAFFWRALAAKGLGLWYRPEDADKMPDCTVIDLLEQIGYDVTDVGAAAYAFCRHFLPEKVATVLPVERLVDDIGHADESLLCDKEFVRVLRAVAYAYRRESKTPCKI